MEIIFRALRKYNPVVAIEGCGDVSVVIIIDCPVFVQWRWNILFVYFKEKLGMPCPMYMWDVHIVGECGVGAANCRKCESLVSWGVCECSRFGSPYKLALAAAEKVMFLNVTSPVMFVARGRVVGTSLL